MEMASRKGFLPLCDVHHTPMKRVVEEADLDECQSYHVCERRDCSRIFRDCNGYSDMIEGGFDDSRASARTCPSCGAILYLDEVDHAHKIENWECPRGGCNYAEQSASPSSR